MSMLRATAVQGLLGDTNFRFLAWMIFLECVPMDKQWWCVAIEENRHDYDRIKCGLSCDPQKKANIGDDGNVLDHPLAQDEGVS